MLIPLISFGLALILLIGFVLIYQEVGFLKKLTFLTTHKTDPFFITSVTLLVLALALGYVGYLGLIEKIIDASSLQSLRRNLGLGSFIFFVVTFRKEMIKYLQPVIKMKIWYFLKSYIYQRRTFLLTSFLLALIAFAWMAPMASPRVIFSINDHTSHIGYIVQAKMALEEGQFPIRVAPLENYGFRYPGFQFYSQLPYTLGGLIYKFLTPSNPYSAYKIMLWLALWTGGLFIYRLAFSFTRSQIASVLGGVAYMSAPYFLNNIHARGAFTEAIAQGILPMVLFYVIKSFYQPSYRHLVLSALAWFALGTTHIITFVYTTIFLGILGGIFIFQTKPDDWKHKLKPLGISYLLGWLLALYFLAPVVLGSGDLSIRKQINAINPFDTNWMTHVENLLAPTSLPSEPTELGIAPTYGLHPAIGWIFLAAFGTVIYYTFANKSFPAKLKRSQPWIVPLLSIFLLALFLTWSPINIWNILPKQLWVTQFTFRFLTHVMWSGALLTAIAIIYIFRERLHSRHLVLGILIIVMISRPWLPIPRGIVTVEELLKEPLFRYSGALDYLYRTPVQKLYGNAQLRLLHDGWIPGYSTWDGFINRPLPLDAYVSYPVWQNSDKPVLHLAAEIPIENIQDQANLLVFVDKQAIASIPLTQKDLVATIPFNFPKPLGETFDLKFMIEGATKDGKPLYLRTKSVYFEGLSPKNTLIPVEQTKNLCKQEGTITECLVGIPKSINTIQLPILYYPKMQKVWVDGQSTEAFSTNYRDFNLVSLELPQGQHQVRVQFVGLGWANWISLLTWLGLIISFVKRKL
ncbi:MAG: hypothetical protein ACRC6M_10060 [Microcystaceae cyanobacterium]